jgi:hypothetical protein
VTLRALPHEDPDYGSLPVPVPEHYEPQLMRLMDKVAQSSGPVKVELKGRGQYAIPGSGSRSKAITMCKNRYFLAGDTLDLCWDINERWQSLFSASNSSLRVPGEQTWLEWLNPSPSDQQSGVLADGGVSGRAGRVESFWSDAIYSVDRAQLHIEFDFDRDLRKTIDDRRRFAVPDAWLPAGLSGHLVFCVDPGWADYFRATTLGAGAIDYVIAAAGPALVSDMFMLLAFQLLLAAAVPLRHRSIAYDRLNYKRQKTGKPPLVSHTEVSVIPDAGIHAMPASHVQSAARLHVVRRHLVHRAGKLFWRSAHLRGGRQTSMLNGVGPAEKH